MRTGDEASDNAMERIADEVEVVNAADVPTVGIWRSTLPPFTQDTAPVPVPVVAPAEAGEHAPSIARDTLVMVLVFATLLAVALAGIAYAIGYASGHRSASTPPHATASTAQSAWHVVWQHSGHGKESVTPPPLTPQDGPRILLAWSCSNSPTMPAGAALNISLSNGAPLASVACPGYGNAVVTVGSDIVRDMLHYGAYSVTMEASGDAPWTLQVERSTANP